MNEGKLFSLLYRIADEIEATGKELEYLAGETHVSGWGGAQVKLAGENIRRLVYELEREEDAQP